MDGSDMPNAQRNDLRVDLLGPVRARELDGSELALGPARQRAVLARLAAAAGDVVTRRELIAAVWGEQAPASAEGNVYTYISGLRRRLDHERAEDERRLVSEGGGYVLRGIEVDLTEFQRRCAQAEGAAAGEAAEQYATALALWQGEPYAGIPGPFAEEQRTRLSELWLATVERRAQVLLDLGRHAEVAPELVPLVRDNPFRESLRAALMLALYRGGRQAEALDVFHDARHVLHDELGAEPGAALRELHEQILTCDPSLDLPAPGVTAAPPEPVPPSVAVGGSPPGGLIGRERELGTLRSLLADVAEGTGHSVWLDGPSGVGKSELLTAGLADARKHGCQLAWAAADELSQRFPLRVMLDCLGIDVRSSDPRRAELARQLQGDGLDSVWHGGDPMFAAVDRLLALVDDLCAGSPLVLVVDDMQWADEASVLVWHRLASATRQQPLLLVGSARPAPGRAELDQVRRAVASRGHTVITVPPLDSDGTAAMLTGLLGGRPGRAVLDMVARADGNPMYLREMADALVRSGSIEVAGGVADIDEASAYDPPTSLVAAVNLTLDGISDGTREVLRMAALLGPDFSVADVAAVTGRTPGSLLPVFDEAVAAKVLVDAGTQLSIRHPLLRHALYSGIPGPMRAALHRHAAQALAEAGAPVRRVAEQLIAAPTAFDTWVAQWLIEHAAELSNNAPHIAAELLRRVVNTRTLSPAHRASLTTALVKVLFRLSRNPETEARDAIAMATTPAQAAEMRQMLAAMLHQRGETEWAKEVLTESLADPGVPREWRSRHLALLANFQRGDMNDAADLDDAERSALASVDEAVAAADAYSLAHAHQTLWQVNSMRRRHDGALHHIDQALTAVADQPELADIQFDLLDNKLFTLQNLDRLPQARATLRAARELTVKHSLPSGLQVSAAVHYYWEGRWDDALVELDTITEDGPAITFYGLREPGPAALLLHGVGALICARRGDRAAAANHLDAAEVHAPATRPEREAFDFLMVAQALAAEQDDDLERALAILSPLLNPGYARMMLRHQWLPDLVRLALRAEDHDRARRALAACEQEADMETVPARAHAALLHCRALVYSNVDSALRAVEHYRRLDRRVELAGALEDTAELHALAGRAGDARQALTNAVELYNELLAAWDIQRAQRRLAAHGIHRPEVAVAKPGDGWAALSTVEVRIAGLVAEGLSNPQIARLLLLPRRTVQAHVARIMRKLGVDSRARLGELASQHQEATGVLSRYIRPRNG
jgi:DNA-binding SARP family transcriptional activator/DNA-binding CsgD family transcriptional regulator